jgi:hypothetical protein
MSGKENAVAVIRTGGGEKPDIHVTVHVHFDGAQGAVGAPLLSARGKARSWVAPVLVIMIAAGAVVAVGRAANHNGGPVAPIAAASTVQGGPPSKEAADGQMPAPVSAALKEKPIIVPPPGAPSAGGAPSGPAAFGLGE